MQFTNSPIVHRPRANSLNTSIAVRDQYCPTPSRLDPGASSVPLALDKTKTLMQRKYSISSTGTLSSQASVTSSSLTPIAIAPPNANDGEEVRAKIEMISRRIDNLMPIADALSLRISPIEYRASEDEFSTLVKFEKGVRRRIAQRAFCKGVTTVSTAVPTLYEMREWKRRTQAEKEHQQRLHEHITAGSKYFPNVDEAIRQRHATSEFVPRSTNLKSKSCFD